MNIERPLALLDVVRCRKNIQRMVDKADRLGLVYRPHFKTHQSAAVGQWFREAGVSSITVSSTAMASYFIQSSWYDVTIAFPASPSQFSAINSLADNTKLKIFLNNPYCAKYYAERTSSPLGVFIEIDAGFHRSGVQAENLARIDAIRSTLRQSPHLQFYGFYVHDGRTYRAKGKDEVRAIIEPVLKTLQKLGTHYPEAKICLGDTPSCSLLDSFEGVDEISPGNHVFYDYMQVGIGSCTPAEVALAVACPVAEVKPATGEAILHGGAVHFSKDRIVKNGQEIYGAAVELSGDNGFGGLIEGSYLKGLSQEHGILHGNAGWISKLKPGDTVCIFPVHSCLSANLFDHYLTLEGERIEKRILS